MKTTKPVCLIILDGWGHREEKTNNAIAEAKTPFFDSLTANYPHTFLNASQEEVGLPKGQMGNSEIGHMTMGAGQIIDVDLVKINKAAAHGEFATNPAFATLFNHVKKYDSTLHITGLIGSGGVHSHQGHLHDFIKTAVAAGITKIAIHAITDGRDLPPQSAARHLRALEKLLAELGVGFIASMQGRFYAMDRDKNWERLAKAESAMFEGAAAKRIETCTPSAVLEEFYKEGVVDEHLEPVVFLDAAGNHWPIIKNDGVFFFNFRPDRARQLSEKVIARKAALNLCFVTLTEYDKALDTLVAFPQSRLETSLAKEISRVGLPQSHIAETEKYAHVTYFFNGGVEKPYDGEQFFLIESRKDVATHDLAPEMRAREIADKAIERINTGDAFLVINFANADMVGHTANQPAIITAVETIDRELKRVIDAVVAHNGAAIVTADHGNAELNIDPVTGERHTSHTINMVPLILISKNAHIELSDDAIAASSANAGASGTLADIAPTILHLLDIPVPPSMTGKSLVA